MNKGNFTAFRGLFQDLYPDLIKVALFYVHDLPAAEDITQEVFVKLWEKQEDIHKIENIKGYLQYAIKNRSLNYLEHLQVVDKYQQEYLKQAKEDEQNPDDYLQLVQRLLNQLPEKRKVVLELSVVEAKSYQEIARQLDISVNTVKDHIKKAYAFLREEGRKEIPNYILYIAFGKI